VDNTAEEEEVLVLHEAAVSAGPVQFVLFGVLEDLSHQLIQEMYNEFLY
jgi:hypothetical protein